MQKVFGIWNTKYHLPKKYFVKYLNAHKLKCIWYLFKYQFLSIWPDTFCHMWFTTVRPVCHTRLTALHYRFFTFWLWGLTPGRKFTKLGGGPQQVPLCHPAEFQPDAQTVYEMCITNLFTFWPWRANPWAKVYQKGRWPATHRDLSFSHISSLWVNPRQRYPLQNICGQTQLHTNKQ